MTRTAEQKAVLALELAATTAISVNWLLYIYLVVNGQALQTSIAYLTTPLLNVALGVGMFAVQSPTFPWMAIVLAASFSVYGLLKRYVPLDAIAQAENITVSNEEVDAEYARLARLHGNPEEEIRRVLARDAVAAALTNQKVQRFLLDHAAVTSIVEKE